MTNKYILKIIIFVIIFVPFALFGFAREQIAPEVSLLESRFSTTEPAVGESFKYFLKFDHEDGVNVHPVDHFSTNGFTVIEDKHLEPQVFEERVIQQYEYTLRSEREGERRFIPVSLQYVGPRKDPVAAQAEPLQITVMPVVTAQIITNSPVMVSEPLELTLSVTQRKPVTITAMPHTLEAVLQVPPQMEEAGKMPALPGEPTPTPSQEGNAGKMPALPGTPEPTILQFEIDPQQITSQQQDGYTVDQYGYNVIVSPQHAGEYIIPEIRLTYRTATGEEIQAHTEETSIFVMNPNTGNLAIRTDYRFLISPAIVATAMALSGLVIFLYVKYRKSRSRKNVIVEPSLPPDEIARRELAQIRAMKLPAKGEFKTYYTMVSESVRKFLGAEFGFHVLERTTEEVMHDIQQRDVPDSLRERTGKFLHEADMVKFAKYVPLLEEADTAMEQALTIVDESVAYHRTEVTKVTSELKSEEVTKA